MVTTRSKTAQTHLEDFATKDRKTNPKQNAASSKKTLSQANTSRKRKSPSVTKEVQQLPKRTKTSPSQQEAEFKDDNDNDIVIINRAPVLHLWAASVAHLTHPELDWESCLSTGSAISTICAVAKGRSIGKIAEKEDKSNSTKKERKQNKEQVEVMHFKLRFEDGLAVVESEGKGKPGGEDALRRKFGDSGYGKVKDVFEEVLKGWQGDEQELNKRAFGMYEEFRPDVSKGQKGWGRKGELNLQRVREVVGKR